MFLLVRSWAKANLILMLISLIFVIVFIIFFFTVLRNSLDIFRNQIDGYNEFLTLIIKQRGRLT